MFSFLDSLTILFSCIILISPLLFIILFIWKKHQDIIIYLNNKATLLFKMYLFNNYLIPNIFSDDSSNISLLTTDINNFGLQHNKLMSIEELKEKIQDIYDYFNEEDILIDKKDLNDMKKDQLFEYYINIQQTKEIMTNRLIIKELIMQMITNIAPSYSSKLSILDFKDVDHLITNLSELLTRKKMSPFGKILFNIITKIVISNKVNVS